MHSFALPKSSKLRRKSVLTNFEPSKVDIEKVKECEIKNIVERHIRTREPLPQGQANYQDVTTIPNDLQARLLAVQQGTEAWSKLPNNIKKIYRTPEEFLRAFSLDSEEKTLNSLGFFRNDKAQETPVSKPQEGEPAKPGDASPSGT